MTGRVLAGILLGLVAACGLAVELTAQSTDPAPPKDEAATPGAGKATPKRGKAASKAEAAKSADEAKSAARLERATFGGGCFWCQEAVFERVVGVKSVVSGYAGGHVARPSYEMVCTGLTGHAEVVQITYDPAVVTYEDLLKIFWQSHDPTTLNRQGPDEGTQYRSIILYGNEEQKKAAQKSYEKLTADHAFASPIVTELVPLTRFYPAERHHQDYYRTHRNEPYCQMEIAPKLMMLKRKFDAAAKAKPATPAPAQ